MPHSQSWLASARSLYSLPLAGVLACISVLALKRVYALAKVQRAYAACCYAVHRTARRTKIAFSSQQPRIAAMTLDRKDSDWFMIESSCSMSGAKGRGSYLDSHPLTELGEGCIWQQGQISQRPSLDGHPCQGSNPNTGISKRVRDAVIRAFEQKKAPVASDNLLHTDTIEALVPESLMAAFAKMLRMQGSAEEDSCWRMASHLFGPPNPTVQPETFKWEPIVRNSNEMLEYDAWRMPWRNNLYLYQTRMQIRNMKPDLIARFQLDDCARPSWDSSAMAIDYQAATSPESTEGSGFISYRAKYPRPMSARQYHYARRVWRPSQDSCFIICCANSAGNVHKSDAVEVTDFMSCVAITPTKGDAGIPSGGTEMTTIYFEDPKLARTGLVSTAVRKGLWRYGRKYAAAAAAYSREI